MTDRPRKATSTLVFGGNGRYGKGISFDSKIVSTVFPLSGLATNFLPLQAAKNSSISFSTKDGKAQQWVIVCQNSFADIADDRYNGIVIEQQFNGAVSYLGSDPDAATGEPQVSLILGNGFPYGTIARVGSIFRAFGDVIRVWPYALQSRANGSLSLSAAQVDLQPYTQTRRASATVNTRIPYFATHVCISGFTGNLQVLDSALAVIDTIVAPVPGTYYPLSERSAFIADSAGVLAATKTVSFRIFG